MNPAMYKILGADQKEYGPAPAEVVKRWIAERRLDARSKIRRDGEPIWRPLGEFPEFANVLPNVLPIGRPATASRPSLSSTASSSPGPTLAGGRRTSGLAIATLVLGIIAPCTAGLAGLIGAILGILALRKISRSQGQLKGRGLAITGLLLSCLFLLTLPPLVFLAMRAQHQARFGGFDPARECIDHAQQLSEAMRRHANDNNDRFPPAATWCDAIQSGASGLNAFQCPARSDLRCGYAYNAALAGKTKFEVAPDTVLLFESDAGWNQAGGPTVAIAAPRHSGSLTVVLVDGSVRQVTRGDLSTLRWNP